MTVQLLLAMLAAYLLGAFPTAYLVGRINGINIFEIGSGNMGATNAIRALGIRWGGLVWVIDLGKGILAVTVARAILAPTPGLGAVIGALGAILGHNWSFFALLLTGRIRGGKGAATWWGTFIMLAPAPLVAAVAVVFTGVVALTRYVSLAVLAGVALGAGAVIALSLGGSLLLAVGQHETAHIYALYAVLAALMVYIRHRDNILRLLRGTERRLGERV